MGADTGITLTPGFLPKPGRGKEKTVSRRLTSLRAATGRHTTQRPLNTRLPEINGARKFLNAVSDQWIAVYATGSLAYGARQKLSVLDISDAEQVVVTASEFSTREELVERAVQRGCDLHGIGQPQRVLCLGDGIWDLKTAWHLGYDFLGIGTGAKAGHLRKHSAIVYKDFVALAASRDGMEICAPAAVEG